MKKMFVLIVFLMSLNAFAEATLDVNINYDPAGYRIKETVCGWVPDLSKGFIAEDNGCYIATYIAAQPVDSFSFIPKSGPVPEPTKTAFYIAFYGNPPKDTKNLHCDITKGSVTVGRADAFFNDNTFQGLAVLDKGQNIKLYSGKKRSYALPAAAVIIIIGVAVMAVLRRRK